jgi:hypothetical protein
MNQILKHYLDKFRLYKYLKYIKCKFYSSFLLMQNLVP